MQLDLTQIIVAGLAALGVILAAWLPVRWGKKAAEQAKRPLEPVEPRQALEFREHERTRDLIRDLIRDTLREFRPEHEVTRDLVRNNHAENRSLFARLEWLVTGKPPANIAELVDKLDGEKPTKP